MEKVQMDCSNVRSQQQIATQVRCSGPFHSSLFIQRGDAFARRPGLLRFDVACTTRHSSFCVSSSTGADHINYMASKWHAWLATRISK